MKNGPKCMKMLDAAQDAAWWGILRQMDCFFKGGSIKEKTLNGWQKPRNREDFLGVKSIRFRYKNICTLDKSSIFFHLCWNIHVTDHFPMYLMIQSPWKANRGDVKLLFRDMCTPKAETMYNYTYILKSMWPKVPKAPNVTCRLLCGVPGSGAWSWRVKEGFSITIPTVWNLHFWWPEAPGSRPRTST